MENGELRMENFSTSAMSIDVVDVVEVADVEKSKI